MLFRSQCVVSLGTDMTALSDIKTELNDLYEDFLSLLHAGDQEESMEECC